MTSGEKPALMAVSLSVAAALCRRVPEESRRASRRCHQRRQCCRADRCSSTVRPVPPRTRRSVTEAKPSTEGSHVRQKPGSPRSVSAVDRDSSPSPDQTTSDVWKVGPTAQRGPAAASGQVGWAERVSVRDHLASDAMRTDGVPLSANPAAAASRATTNADARSLCQSDTQCEARLPAGGLTVGGRHADLDGPTGGAASTC